MAIVVGKRHNCRVLKYGEYVQSNKEWQAILLKDTVAQTLGFQSTLIDLLN